MDLAKVLQQLHEELQHLDAAILSLERLQRKNRRGRPPTLLADARAAIRGEAQEKAKAPPNLPRPVKPRP
ncbi:MAG TPA: hypothetical protein VE959_17790 [Bryobacteraceae bacterium]|nr:hypothetical protein [Bryobacteraceae bacterium]